MTRGFFQKISREMRALIDEGRPEIASQFMRDERETILADGELADPIGDLHFSPLKGITHRYPGRVLLKPIMHCAVHCRFCFRREMVGQEVDLTPEEIKAALRYIAEHREVEEVILTGGDPLMMSGPTLGSLLREIESVPHVRSLRVHTRIPVVQPSLVSTGLTEALATENKVTWVVVHTNAAAEITADAKAAIRRLRIRGTPLLSQSVLLKGVNDTPQALRDLFSALIGQGVKPYYLHYPDLVRGTAHFRIPLDQAIALVESVGEQVSGHAVPRLCVDLPHGLGKVFPPGNGTEQVAPGKWRFTSPLSGEKVDVTFPS